jgi:hypothetical protein
VTKDICPTCNQPIAKAKRDPKDCKIKATVKGVSLRFASQADADEYVRRAGK